ncbi:MAG: alanine dehydrogenase, partial [Crocinitomicaceae bacterium]
MITNPEILQSLLHQGSLSPQEEMLEIKKKKGELFIGIPKEISFQERRVALVPEAVSL